MSKKVHLMSLIVSCPLNKPVDDCPFNEYRDISILELIERVNDLTEEEIVELANEHKECLRSRKMAFQPSGNKTFKKAI